jgi:carboxymethylenebutenolidase
MSEQNVKMKVPDGTEMHAYVKAPAGPGPFPGLMVFPEAFGVNHHMRAVVDRFADAGFVAISPELYHRTAPPGWECGYGEFDKVKPHLQAITPETLLADSRACWSFLKDHPKVGSERIASVGYCLGGRASFVANLGTPLKAAISYYGGGIAPDLVKRASELHGPMLFFWGGLDKHIGTEAPVKVGEALRAAGKRFINVEISFADHGFSCDERPSYNPEATREATALTLAFLREHLG